ncbi:MAG TPA: hypothetical protein VJR48_02890 [Ktedonobacterales bacterium]|nr:hypothetical protein [Ktedonobacterales bacterium]
MTCTLRLGMSISHGIERDHWQQATLARQRATGPAGRESGEDIALLAFGNATNGFFDAREIVGT